jgi:hypothetical protein
MDYSIYETNGEEKELYTNWKRARDDFLARGEQVVIRQRIQMISKVAAAMGNQLLNSRRKGDEEDNREEINPTGMVVAQEEERIETTWNERLKNGWMFWDGHGEEM